MSFQSDKKSNYNIIDNADKLDNFSFKCDIGCQVYKHQENIKKIKDVLKY